MGTVGERLNEAQSKYERILAEGRAGTRYQSRRKILILAILEYHLHLMSAAVL